MSRMTFPSFNYIACMLFLANSLDEFGSNSRKMTKEKTNRKTKKMANTHTYTHQTHCLNRCAETTIETSNWKRIFHPGKLIIFIAAKQKRMKQKYRPPTAPKEKLWLKSLKISIECKEKNPSSRKKECENGVKLNWQSCEHNKIRKKEWEKE